MVSRVWPSERFAAAGGLLVLIGLRMRWYELDLAGRTHAISGWHAVSLLRWLLVASALLAIVLAVARPLGATLSRPVRGSVLLASLAGLDALLVIRRWPDPPAAHLNVRLGLFVTLVGCAIVAVGAQQTMAVERASFRELGAAARRLAGALRAGGRSPDGRRDAR